MLHTIYVTFWTGDIICSVVAKERDIKGTFWGDRSVLYYGSVYTLCVYTK